MQFASNYYLLVAITNKVQPLDEHYYFYLSVDIGGVKGKSVLRLCFVAKRSLFLSYISPQRVCAKKKSERDTNHV